MSDLKEKGNEFFSKGDYEKAIACYSEALSIQPQSHVILSNRSAAYIKLKLYQKAHDDSVECVALAPEFARGYLRKASALNGLEKYSEAIPVAEEGYRLRGSDRICLDCVGQWLLASRAMLEKDMANLCDIPTGISPLTENCVKVLYEIQQQSSSGGLGGISVETLEKHFFIIVEELEHILKRFGHSLSPCMFQWTGALLQALKLDPRIHAPPPAIIELLTAKSKELIKWLDREVDHLLYPVIQPIFGLLVFDILACIVTLRQMVSFRSRIQVLIKACLIFYDSSILSAKQYLGLHIHALQELLNSFCMETGHAKQRDKEEALEIKEIIKNLKSLLNKYDVSCGDYNDVKESTERVIDSASILLSSKDATSHQSSRKLTKDDTVLLKKHVLEEIEKLTLMNNLHVRDMDSLILATGKNYYYHTCNTIMHNFMTAFKSIRPSSQYKMTQGLCFCL